MSNYFTAFILLLFLLPSTIAVHEVGHVDGPVAAPSASQEQTSRFLSAEAQRLIQDEFKALEVKLTDYQDENFIALDSQLKSSISESTQKLIIGALGATLLGGAIVAFIMFNLAKKYSYEKFLEDNAQGLSTDTYDKSQNLGGMQQEDWGSIDNNVNPTVSDDFGQSYASNNSEMSEWQEKAPYNGGWDWKNGGGNQQ